MPASPDKVEKIIELIDDTIEKKKAARIRFENVARSLSDVGDECDSWLVAKITAEFLTINIDELQLIRDDLAS